MNTRRFKNSIAIVIGVFLLLAILIDSKYELITERDRTYEMTCTFKDGHGECVHEGINEFGLIVFEDGSFAASGCLEGWPCDDGAAQQLQIISQGPNETGTLPVWAQLLFFFVVGLVVVSLFVNNRSDN